MESEENKLSPLMKSIIINMNKIKEATQSSVDSHIDENIKSNKREFKIVDIGSANGRNSIIFLNVILSIIRSQLPAEKKIVEVYHADLPSNDFTKLFLEINNSVDSYEKKFKNVYSYAIGNTFMNQLMPNESCDIIFSFNCIHWSDFDEPYFKNRDSLVICKETTRTTGMTEFIKNKLNKLILNRYNELKLGGVFICNHLFVDMNDEKTYNSEQFFGRLKSIFRDMANQGVLSHEEVDDMIIPITYYNDDECRDACLFSHTRGFSLLHEEKYYFSWDSINNSYQANEHFIHSIMEYCAPCLKKSIKGDPEKINSIYNQFLFKLLDNIKNNISYSYSLGFKLVILKKTN